jgi:hypothetical protein
MSSVLARRNEIEVLVISNFKPLLLETLFYLHAETSRTHRDSVSLLAIAMRQQGGGAKQQKTDMGKKPRLLFVRTAIIIISTVGSFFPQTCSAARKLHAIEGYNPRLKTCTNKLDGMTAGCDFECPKHSCVKAETLCVKDFRNW